MQLLHRFGHKYHYDINFDINNNNNNFVITKGKVTIQGGIKNKQGSFSILLSSKPLFVKLLKHNNRCQNCYVERVVKIVVKTCVKTTLHVKIVVKITIQKAFHLQQQIQLFDFLMFVLF